MGPHGDYESVASIHQIPDEGMLGVVRSDGERLCLIRHLGRVTAVSNVCTHQEFEMSLGDILPDGTIQCAWHGTRFDCNTGEVRQGPAAVPLPVFEVRIVNDSVLVGPRRGASGVGEIASSAASTSGGGDER